MHIPPTRFPVWDCRLLCRGALDEKTVERAHLLQPAAIVLGLLLAVRPCPSADPTSVQGAPRVVMFPKHRLYLSLCPRDPLPLCPNAPWLRRQQHPVSEEHRGGKAHDRQTRQLTFFLMVAGVADTLSNVLAADLPPARTRAQAHTRAC